MVEANGKAPSMSMIGLGGGGGGGESNTRGGAGMFRFLSFASLNSNILSRLFNTSEAENAEHQLSILWTSARPWKEFFNTRKMVPPTINELRERLMDNLPYFFPNYLLIFFALSMLGVLVHPLSFIALIILLVVYVILFLQNPGLIRVGPLVMSEHVKVGVFLISAFGLLYLTNAIAILGSWAAFSVILSMAHAGARISAKEPDFETPADQV